MTKVKLSITDLENHLKEQVAFLQRSAKAFDQGYLVEAKRIAVIVRLLVHDTTSSKSLLGLLNLKKIRFLATSPEYDENTKDIGSFNGLALLEMNTAEGARFIPRCSIPVKSPQPHTWKEFDGWWHKTVIKDAKNQEFSRKKLVLALANKEGGAHVDPELDVDYAALSRDNSMGWYYEAANKKGPVEDIELASCRQIAHEILESLKRVRPDLFKKTEV